MPDILVYNVDISDWDKTRHIVQQIGPVDILVNNAAILINKPFLELDKKDLFKYKVLLCVNCNCSCHISVFFLCLYRKSNNLETL